MLCTGKWQIRSFVLEVGISMIGDKHGSNKAVNVLNALIKSETKYIDDEKY